MNNDMELVSLDPKDLLVEELQQRIFHLERELLVRKLVDYGTDEAQQTDKLQFSDPIKYALLEVFTQTNAAELVANATQTDFAPEPVQVTQPIMKSAPLTEADLSLSKLAVEFADSSTQCGILRERRFAGPSPRLTNPKKMFNASREPPKNVRLEGKLSPANPRLLVSYTREDPPPSCLTLDDVRKALSGRKNRTLTALNNDFVLESAASQVQSARSAKGLRK